MPKSVRLGCSVRRRLRGRCLKDEDEQRKSHRQLGKDVAERDRELKLKPVNITRAIQCLSPEFLL